MADFDLDLRSIEEHIEDADGVDRGGRIVLGILDGTTPAEDWIEAIDQGDVLVLDIQGELNELAAGFARQIKDDGGHLVRFRGFLIITPPGLAVDTSRLSS